MTVVFGSETGSSPVNSIINSTILRVIVVLMLGLIGHAIGYESSRAYTHQGF